MFFAQPATEKKVIVRNVPVVSFGRSFFLLFAFTFFLLFRTRVAAVSLNSLRKKRQSINKVDVFV